MVVNSQFLERRQFVEVPELVVDAMQLAESDAEQIPCLGIQIVQSGGAFHRNLGHHLGYDVFGFLVIDLQFEITAFVGRSGAKALHQLVDQGRRKAARGREIFSVCQPVDDLDAVQWSRCPAFRHVQHGDLQT